MSAVLATRKPEPGERVDSPGWYGFYGAFLTIEEAQQCKAELNRKGGYNDIRIVELSEAK